MSFSSRAALCFVSVFGLVLASACQNDPSDSSDGTTTSPSPSEPGIGNGNSPSASNTDGGVGNESSSGSVDDPLGNDAPPRPYVHFDINHILSTGQSNSVANDGKPILSTTQPYSNLMFDTGVMTASGCDQNGCTKYDVPNGFLPLVEGDSFFYPVETMSAGLANQVSFLDLKKSHAILISLHGRSGNSYGCLRKGSCGWWPDKNYLQPFDEAMRTVQDGLRLAKAQGKSYVVRAVTAIHGEHDHYAYASGDSAFPMTGTDGTSVLADYADALLEWQKDYDAGVKAITGQSIDVPLFINQYSHWNNVPTTKIAYMQLDAHVRSAGKVQIVAPTYALPYTDSCLHFTGHGERHLGEYFAKAYMRTVIDGRRWEPLRPTKVTVAGNVVTAKFHVPVPPLALDTTRVSDPGNYGFEWFDTGASPAITGVEVVGADTVKVTLASAPGPGGRLRYAYTFRGCSGNGSIARGNLRDSDGTLSQNGYELFNWSVHFDMAAE